MKNATELNFAKDIKKLAAARGVDLDGMLARDIAAYIAEAIEAARAEATEAAEDDADEAADHIEEAAADFVRNNSQAGGGYYRQDLRQFLAKISDALGYIPAYGQAERIEALQVLTY